MNKPKEDIFEVVKKTPSIGEFTDMIHAYRGVRGKRSHRGQLHIDTSSEEAYFHYVLLGDDVVIWDQHVTIKIAQRIVMTPVQEGPISYVFTYFMEASKSLYING